MVLILSYCSIKTSTHLSSVRSHLIVPSEQAYTYSQYLYFHLHLLYNSTHPSYAVASIPASPIVCRLIIPSQSATSIFTISAFPSRPASPVVCHFSPYSSITTSHTHIHSTCISIKICYTNSLEDQPYRLRVHSHLIVPSQPATSIFTVPAFPLRSATSMVLILSYCSIKTSHTHHLSVLILCASQFQLRASPLRKMLGIGKNLSSYFCWQLPHPHSYYDSQMPGPQSIRPTHKIISCHF